MNAPDPLARPRRFYAKVETAAAQDGVRVLLDGRTTRTPKGAVLALPTQPLADLVSAEWAAQGETVDLAGMIATRLARTAIDGGEAAAAAAREAVLRFAGSDLVCYFAEGPRELIARQEAVWGPLIAWAEADLGLLFTRTSGVVHQLQSPQTLERLERRLAQEDAFALAGLALAAALTGSAVIALALRRGRLDAAGAVAAARLDEIFQEAQWGVDDEAASKAAALASDLALLEGWFLALG